MKHCWKRSWALLMALMMLVLCLAGCGGDEQVSSEGFSLTFAEPVDHNKEEMQKTYDRWLSLSDVPITFDKLTGSDTAEALNLRFASGDYPEVILGNLLQAADVSRYAANGVLIPLNEYINEKDTPNLYAFFEKHPDSKAVGCLPDGNMYSLLTYNGLGTSQLENVFWINKVWLDKLGLEIPKTTDELKEVLKAFKTKDPNGNGQADEIPMTFLNKHAYAYPEVMLSAWGKATKFGNYDSYLTVNDGKVEFAPVTDEWKEMIRFYRDLYSEGLLDMECFTQTNENFFAKIMTDTSKVGFLWHQKAVMTNPEEYIAIEPIRAGDADPVWRIHPASLGNYNQFFITTACKNPKAAMMWIDKFYDLDQYLVNEYGEVGTVFTVQEDGTYTWNDPPEGMSLSSFINDSTVLYSPPGAIEAEDYGTKIEMMEEWETSAVNYNLYEKYLDDEPWPRPYYSPEDTARLGELNTDIFTYVEEKKAKWIVGSADIETEWEEYNKKLNELGLEELMEIITRTYKNYLKNMK